MAKRAVVGIFFPTGWHLLHSEQKRVPVNELRHKDTLRSPAMMALQDRVIVLCANLTKWQDAAILPNDE